MKIITKEGVQYFQNKYAVHKIWGDERTFRMRFSIEKRNLNYILDVMREKSIDYELKYNFLELTQEHLAKLLPEKYFVEKRVWFGTQKMYFCSEMEHAHLSNIIGVFDLMLRKGKISKLKAIDFLKKVEANIIPELEERFDGVILDYKPYYEWEKEMLLLPDVEVKTNF